MLVAWFGARGRFEKPLRRELKLEFGALFRDDADPRARRGTLRSGDELLSLVNFGARNGKLQVRRGREHAREY